MTLGSGVVVVGSLTVDLTSWSERPPEPGETLLGTDFTMVPGGKGANQVLMAARMGAAAWMIGCIGDDILHDVVLGELTAAGVNTSYVRVCPGERTGVAHIRVVDGTGENNIVIVPLANEQLTPDHVDTALAELTGRRGASVMLVQLEIPAKTAMHALRTGRDKGMITVLDPAPAVELPHAIYRSVDIVTPNETEAGAITGVKVVDLASARQAAQWFLDRGTKTAVITLGSNGVLTATAGGWRHIPAPAVTAVDTTAAGDGFAGVLGASLAVGDRFAEAVEKGVAAGALTVGKAGASSSLPARDEVEALFQDLPSKNSKAPPS